MFKRLMLVSAAMAIAGAAPAYGGQWMQDGNGWWWQKDDGSYPFMTWAWCDGDHDGIAENYCFDESGYLSMNPVDQGVPVNEDGAAFYKDENLWEEIEPYELAYRIVDLVNEERESRGKNGLAINDELMENAMVRADEASENFSHTRPNGSRYDTAITVDYSLAGENIHGGGVTKKVT